MADTNELNEKIEKLQEIVGELSMDEKIEK